MKTIRDLLARDLNRKIEEIIKLDQTDEQSVYTEITEYVATQRIREEYRKLFKAIAEGPAEPSEGIGVWVSGFFGSGKSSFAKNLGYVLANRSVLGHQAAELFKRQVADLRIDALIDSINARIPTELVMFDVSVDKAVKKSTERIAELMYTVLLRTLDYAEDFDIAELEIELEKEGRLDEFVRRCAAEYGDWRVIRKGAQKIARASTILHTMAQGTYPAADSWARSIGAKVADITVGRFVDRAFELTARRRPGKALVFIIDEVGQYVARSADKIEDLRVVVEEFGKESKNRQKRREAVAPVWVIVTSQEKLDEVVAAIDSKRVELAKLQDRFRYRVDLSPADIREVATRRVLAKRDEAVPVLRKLFAEHQGQINAACRLERTTRKSEVREENFIQFYPYLPHFVELSIDIMSGIRLQPGAPKHYGGSNRTIIKQAYEMLISERTRVADRPVGALISLDLIFELVNGNLSTEKQKDLSDIEERFAGDPADAGWASRVAKAICLLEFVRDLPRTEANLAALLIERVGQPAPLAEVEVAVKRLAEAQFIRNAEDGWKLQTAQEKNWETERRSYLDPKPKFREEIKRDVLTEIFADAKLRTYRFKDLRTFRVGVTLDGVKLGEEGQVPLVLLAAEGGEEWSAKTAAARDESRTIEHRNEIYWVFSIEPEIDNLIRNLYASHQMVMKYDQLRAQNRITNEESACLDAEKNEAGRYQTRLREKLVEALGKGQGFFRGIAKDASDLGRTLSEIFKNLFDSAVPDLYPKLEMGARSLNGNEAEEILKAANLGGLSQVFYGGERGLNLVVKDGVRFVPNPAAPVAVEILNYLKKEHNYGNKIPGKDLEEHFQRMDYGWDRDLLRMVLATLLRAGAIEVIHQGRRFRNHLDPQCRVPFTNNVAFKAASFAPRESLDLKTLTTAVQRYEGLTGDEVDVEEAAIASAIKKVAGEELKELLPLAALAQANHLPVGAVLEEYRATLESILTAASDECVTILAGEGRSLKESRDQVREIRGAFDEAGLAVIRQARHATGQAWPALAARGLNPELAAAATEVASLSAAPEVYAKLAHLSRLTKEILTTYRDAYLALHRQRAAAFAKAVEEVKGLPECGQVAEHDQGPALAPLTSRACDAGDLADAAAVCEACHATMSEMESDLVALAGLKSRVIARIQELTAPEAPPVTRVRIAELVTGPLESEEAVNTAMELLREHLYKLVAAGARIVLE